MTRGQAGGLGSDTYPRVVVICMSPVCLSVGRYRFIKYRGGRSGGGGVSRRRGGSAHGRLVIACYY